MSSVDNTPLPELDEAMIERERAASASILKRALAAADQTDAVTARIRTLIDLYMDYLETTTVTAPLGNGASRTKASE